MAIQTKSASTASVQLNSDRAGMAWIERVYVAARVNRPIVIALATLFVLCAYLAHKCFVANDNHFVYALDDPYIHMAIAKNLLLHGVYGVTRYGTTTASSSILWPWILAAADMVSGINVLTPYLLNVAFAVVLVIQAAAIFRSAMGAYRNDVLMAVCLMGLIAAAPLPTLCQVGMEHIAQSVAILGLLYSGCKTLASSSPRKLDYQTAIFAAAATGLRYEGIFLVLLITGAFILTRRYGSALLVAFGGMLPIVVYGLISITHHQYFFPNSVLVKTIPSAGNPLIYHLEAASENIPGLLFLALVSTVLALISTKRRELYGWIWFALILFPLAVLMHVAAIGNYIFFRYQAYMVIMGVVTVGAYLCRYVSIAPKQKLYSWCAASAIVLTALIFNPIWAISTAVTATNNIYRQQYLDAQFIKTNYNHGTVLLNDIGAVAFYSDAHLIDFMGLSSKDFATMRLKHQITNSNVARYVDNHHPDVGIVYTFWLPGTAPQWQFTAQRKVTPNIVCASDTVTYVAFSNVSSKLLSSQIKQFFGNADQKTTTLFITPGSRDDRKIRANLITQNGR